MTDKKTRLQERWNKKNGERYRDPNCKLRFGRHIKIQKIRRQWTPVFLKAVHNIKYRRIIKQSTLLFLTMVLFIEVIADNFDYYTVVFHLSSLVFYGQIIKSHIQRLTSATLRTSKIQLTISSCNYCNQYDFL